MGLALLSAGCPLLETRYAHAGAGSDPNVLTTGGAARLRELYLGWICRQAGLPVSGHGETVACDLPPVSNSWTLLVQAGMDDIDRRCDAYLTWLDDRWRVTGRTRQRPLGTKVAPRGILGEPIAIVAAAFGLPPNAFMILNRPTLEVENSVLQSAVLARQKKYRQSLPAIVDNGRAATYALREYLRLCVPMTVERQIKNRAYPR